MEQHAGLTVMGGTPSYPPRSSSYRVYSVINAYGGDPGIQFSPTQSSLQKRPSRVQSAVQPFSIQENDETYGSDPDLMAGITEDDYDPYRQDLPVHLGPKQKENEWRTQKLFDQQVSQQHVEEVIGVRAAVKDNALDKALPPVPKDDNGGSRKRKDSALSVGDVGDMTEDWKTGLTPTLLQRQDLEEIEITTLPSPKEEVTFVQVSRSMERQQRPFPLKLQRSNGSTAASLTSISTAATELQSKAPKNTPLPPIPPLSKTHTPISHQQGNATFVVKSSGASGTSLTYQSNNSKPLLQTTSPPPDRPLPSLPSPAQSTARRRPALDAADENDFIIEPNELSLLSNSKEVEDTTATNETNGEGVDMRLFKNLVTVRKTVRSESNASFESTPSSAVNRENRPFYSAPLLGTFLGNKFSRSKSNLTDTSKKSSPSHSEGTSTATKTQSSLATSPNESTAKVLDLSRSPAPISEPSIAESQDEGLSDHGPSTPKAPPALLPQPSPVSHFEQSPSKYALKNKSEKTLVKDETQRDRRSKTQTGAEQFKNIADSLKEHFTTLVNRGHIEEAIALRETTLANEEVLDIILHPSMLPLMRSRPAKTNAAKLGTIQLHCHVNHYKWWESNNGPTPSPSTDCALCYLGDELVRWTCAYCALSVCTKCKERIDKATRGTPLQKKIDNATEELAHLREEKFAQMAWSSRPPSAESLYDSLDMDMDRTPRANSGMSMRSCQRMGNLRSYAPQYKARVRRPSHGGNVPVPEDYPPPPRIMAAQYPPGSPMRGRSPSRGTSSNASGCTLPAHIARSEYLSRSPLRGPPANSGYGRTSRGRDAKGLESRLRGEAYPV